jgi:hypothetical protein
MTLVASFAFVFSPGVTGTGIGKVYAASGCPGTDAPAGTDCASIPLGCPGSSKQGPVAPGSVKNCPYVSNQNGVGCNGSNAPLNTNCGNIPFGCPGTTKIGPGTGKNCPYSGKDLATTTTTSSQAAGAPDCYKNGDPMTYVLCPIFNALAGASDWLFTNIISPFLVTEPVGTSSSDPSFQIWSSFRVYGDILLVIAVLVVVIGQAIGGGLVDAYTVKKVLPRVLLTAILINLSVYIVAFLVDITNILGRTIGDVLTAPIRASGQWNFTPNVTQGAGVFGIGLLGLLLASGGIAALVGGIFFSGNIAGAANFSKIALYAAFWVILPIILAVLAVFITLVIRKGLILFLIMISPVAFALYCLPNTEKYFKKWWDLLLEALMVYPIIVVIFAVADILAVTILGANSITSTQIGANGFASKAALSADQVIAVIVAFFLQFLPLLAIPFAFRMAGGTLGKLHEAVTNGGNKLNEMANSRRENAKRDYRIQSLQGRENVYNRANAFASKQGSNRFTSALRRGTGGFFAGRAGGYNLQAAMSAQRAQIQKELQDQIATGDDTEIRALTVDKRTSARRQAADGSIEYQSLGGRWVSEASVDRAQSRWKGNQMAQQEALSYEMKKATTQEQIDGLTNNYGNLARSWGLNDQQAMGQWKGAAFANQGANLEYKYHSWNAQTGQLELDGNGLMTEVDEKKGSYDMGKMSATTWESMQKEVQRSRTVLADPSASAADRDKAQSSLQRASRIARTYVQQRGMGGSQMVGEGDDMHPVAVPGGGAGGGGFVTSVHGAAGRVQEEAENFVHMMHDGTVTTTNPHTGVTTTAPEVQTPVPSTYQSSNPMSEGWREQGVYVGPGGAPRSNPANEGRDRPNVGGG